MKCWNELQEWAWTSHPCSCMGLGTFRPVEVEDITLHHMHAEYYEILKLPPGP